MLCHHNVRWGSPVRDGSCQMPDADAAAMAPLGNASLGRPPPVRRPGWRGGREVGREVVVWNVRLTPSKLSQVDEGAASAVRLVRSV